MQSIAINILILNYEYPPLGGGAGMITKYHAEGLAKLGHKVTVVTTWFEGEKEIEKKGDLKIIRLKSLRRFIHKSNPIEMLSWINKTRHFLFKSINEKEFNICLANFAIPGGIVAYGLKKKFNIPYFVISHGQDIPWFLPKQMFLYHLLNFYWLRKIFRQSEGNFIQTDEMKKSIEKFLGDKKKGKNIVIPNGCEVQIFKPDYSKKSKLFKIIFVGRLVEQKDPFTFLKAIKLYSTTNNNFIVHILGDGPLRKKMEGYVSRNHLKDNVKFFGWVTKGRLIEEYQTANLQIAPSLDEGMSVAVLEALSCGQYIIATPASGNTDVIKESVNGELVNYRDYKGIANRIKKYYEEKFSKNYTVPEDFLNKFRMKYEWSNVVRKYDELLQKISEK